MNATVYTQQWKKQHGKESKEWIEWNDEGEKSADSCM